MTDFNEPGHVDPASGLVAITLARFRLLPDGTKGFVYTRAPGFGGSGLDPWRSIGSIVPHTHDTGFDVWFNESSMGLTLNPSMVGTQVIYVEAEHAPKPPSDPARSQVDRALNQLRGAVERARAAADEAERSIKDHAHDPAYAAARVMHALAWGHANAISCVESALAASEDAHTIRRLSAEEKPR